MEISIHALRVEGDDAISAVKARLDISIHALRVEGDDDFRDAGHLVIAISIHALRVEGDC